MDIEKSIEILTHWQSGGDITSFDDVNTAVKLGIEALKLFKDTRLTYNGKPIHLLPGETKDLAPIKIFPPAPNKQPGVPVEHTGKPTPNK